MRVASILVLALAGLAGCEPIATEETTVPRVSTPDTSSTGTPATNDAPSGIPSTPSSSTPPDNTAINERDADGNTKTPIDQDENQTDINISAKIREQIVATEGLSLNAQNAKVITSAGKVTLRGPVETAAERDTLGKIAKDVAGEGNVDNQLEVSP
jgi:hypothetical protein